MARKAKDESNPVNLDSLMDALTNVVGILVIVFVLVQLNVADSVDKVLESIESVSEEQFQEMQQVDDAAEQQTISLQQQLEEQQESQDSTLEKLELQKLKRQSLDIEWGQARVVYESASALEDEIKQMEEDMAPLREQEKELAEEREKLASLLAAAEAKEVVVAQKIRMPNPRPIPENAEIYDFFVIDDRIAFLNEDKFKEQFMDAFDKEKRGFEHSEKEVDGEDVQVYDQDLVADYMNDKARLGSRDLRIETFPIPTWNRLKLRFHLTDEGGETIADIAEPASNFQRAMRKIAAEGNAVAFFHVHRESINSYLAARELADEIGTPAGWKMQWDEFWEFNIYDFEVNVKEEPAPTATNTFDTDAPADSLD